MSVASAVWRDCKLLYEGPWQTRDWVLLQFCIWPQGRNWYWWHYNRICLSEGYTSRSLLVSSLIFICNFFSWGGGGKVLDTPHFSENPRPPWRNKWSVPAPEHGGDKRSLPRHEHVTSSFIRLHWLPIKFRINFKIAMLSFKCIRGHAPNYLKSMVAIKKTSTYNLRSSTSIQLEDHLRR